MKKRLMAWLLVLSLAVPFAAAEEIEDAATEAEPSEIVEETEITEVINTSEEIPDAEPADDVDNSETVTESDVSDATVSETAQSNMDTLSAAFGLSEEEICAILGKTAEEINSMPTDKLEYAETVISEAMNVTACAVYSGSCGDNATWTLDDGVLTIEGSGNINELAFDENTDIESVIIKDGIESIGDCAFFGCTSLTSVTIWSGLTSIGESAFKKCKSLNEVIIPNTVTSIGDCAFEFCTGLTDIPISRGVTQLKNGTFDGCTGLTNVTIPDNITSLEDSVFNGCTNLQNVTIPDSVTAIGQYTFMGCKNLKSITLPDSISTIRDGLFFDTGLTIVTIPKSVTSIESGAFENCPDLKNVILSKNVQSIGDYAFGATMDPDSKTETYSADFTIYSYCGDAGYNYAKKNGLTFYSIGHADGVKIDGTPATCTETGLTDGEKCSICGTITNAQAVIPAKGHSYVITEDKPATCTEAGLTHGIKCSVCENVMIAQTEIPAKGHTVVIDPAVEATSQASGLTEGSHCSVCGTIIVEQSVIPALADSAIVSGKTSITATLGRDMQIYMANGLRAVGYKSSSQKILTVSADGLITPIKAGKAKVTITLSNKKKTTLTVTVIDPTLATSVALNATGAVTLYMGETLNLAAAMQPSTATSALTWKSSSTKIAKVSSTGEVTPVKEGTVTITVTTATKKSASVKVKVVDPYKPASIAFAAGSPTTVELHSGSVKLSTVLTASVNNYEPKTILTWKSSSTKIAKVSSDGTLTPVKEGTVTITVTTANGKKATLKVKVVDGTKPASIAFTADTPATVSISGGAIKLSTVMTATMEGFEPKTTLTWKSSSKKIAKISSNGTLTPLKSGTVTITVTTANGKKTAKKIKIIK